MRTAMAIVILTFILWLVSRPTSALQGSDRVSPIDFIHMFNAGIGWAKTAGCDPCSSKVIPSLILRTTDSGTRWQNVTPLDPSGERIVVGGFYAFNSQIAWVGGRPKQHNYGGPCTTCSYRTIDGGQTWKAISKAPSVFINPLEGWTLDSVAFAMQSEAVEVYRSTDGGETWIKIASTEDRGSGLPEGGFKRGMTFLNSKTGWINWEYLGSKVPILYVTHDSGLTWRPQELPIPPRVERERSLDVPPTPGLPKFFTAQDGIVRVDFPSGHREKDWPPKSLVVFYATHNSGTTWTPTTPVPVTQIYQQPSDFVSMDRGWLKQGEQAEMLYMTNDGGRNWTTTRFGPLFTAVTQLNFTTPKVGWAVRNTDPGGGGARQTPPFLLRTLDGGRTWVPVPYTIMGQ
jgi:hypothetical protein